ncbi:AlpA family transcriptional regulator [Methyloversatilis sp.]|uniref:helix-turn-helix transcriptional regulator n=1 Tax=Methyloversatilis sp. TaxID=2569862 RepID=UPI002733E8A6|nr:AlpA family phage regulatory protein [Methyloversatilis sp.]
MHAGFLRLPHIIGDTEKRISPLIPVSRSTWYAGVASGRYPKPIKLSEGVTVWRASDIDALCAQIEQQAEVTI